GEQVAGRPRDAEPPLDQLDGDQRADEPAEHALAAQHRLEIAAQRRGWIGGPVEQLAPDRAADDRRDDQPAARVLVERVASPRALPAEELRGGEVAQRLEEG